MATYYGPQNTSGRQRSFGVGMQGQAPIHQGRQLFDVEYEIPGSMADPNAMMDASPAVYGTPTGTQAGGGGSLETSPVPTPTTQAPAESGRTRRQDRMAKIKDIMETPEETDYQEMLRNPEAPPVPGPMPRVQDIPPETAKRAKSLDTRLADTTLSPFERSRIEFQISTLLRGPQQQ